jgi:hypothetical protein
MPSRGYEDTGVAVQNMAHHTVMGDFYPGPHILVLHVESTSHVSGRLNRSNVNYAQICANSLAPGRPSIF